ncbi:hypothetical protein EJ02DRAFT_71836 [Clathrospora elynae]|uniref:Uncharacterized protein n=1 Tax=Clathrospora elynae TaxID=706981 RepID=A0A6A5SZQ3_9PLEO|nr:hypothetical protein EJ02DRAFT_71836 [Clathrospora elynae]
MAVEVVTEDPIVVEAFRGYVLTVELTCKDPQPLPEVEIYAGMWDSCAHVGVQENLRLSFTMAAILDTMRRTRYLPAFDDYFSEKTQGKLLMPFKTLLRGYKDVTITDHIDDDIGRGVRDDMARE